MKRVRRSIVGALLFFTFSCANGANGAEPATPAASRADACGERAAARSRLDRDETATPEDPDFAHGSPVHDARRVIDGLAPRLLACRGYDRTLDACVIMQARVSKAGTVVTSEPFESGGAPEYVTACLADELRTARFAGGEREATLFVPILFVPSRRWAR